jgi:hypothetical protein
MFKYYTIKINNNYKIEKPFEKYYQKLMLIIQIQTLFMFNNNSDFSDKSRISNHIILISIISVISFFMLFGYYNLTVIAQESNSQLQNKDINIAAVGDFYCNDESEDYY